MDINEIDNLEDFVEDGEELSSEMPAIEDLDEYDED
jgi:hypothetical protein